LAFFVTKVQKYKSKGACRMTDIIIIGAGVAGCAVARELSKYQVKICVVEKEEDVCCGTSKANSAIVHAGYDAAEGSLMAKLNVQGNEMMEALSKELDFSFQRNGSLIICLNKEDRPNLEKLYQRGLKNGVKGLQILTKEEVLQMEPNINENIEGALYAPTGGIVCPFGLTTALAENAYNNGVEFKFNTEVLDIIKEDGFYQLKTNQGTFEAKYVINAAGVYGDRFHNMVSKHKIHITARRGDYCLLDKSVGDYVSRTIFQVPTKYGKGVLVTPTVHGNLLVGPTAIDIQDKEAIEVTQEGLSEVIAKANHTVKSLPIRQVITSFAGLRAHEDGHEFIIGEVEDAKGFIDVVGIESPGLTSAPAIGVMTADIVQRLMQLEKKASFIGRRKGITHFSELTMEEKNKLIQQKPAYGNIICRCEMITEGEILEAIHRPLGATSLDGIKRRTRAGMGRCQAGFCAPKTMEILSRELQLDLTQITKAGKASQIVVGHNKDKNL
jgi:glycerol-3-phosphate dehydrogenase